MPRPAARQGAFNLPDWITDFLSYTEGSPSPKIFRLWSAIGAVSAALERRAWVISMDDLIYPNMYILLVGDPGSGKSEGIKRVRAIFDKTSTLLPEDKRFSIAAHSNTRASLVDALFEAHHFRKINDVIVEYSSIIVCVDELSNFMPSYDLDMLGLITRVYDNPQTQEERRRHAKVQTKSIFRPTLHFLAGVQPAFMASLLPQEAFNLGFPSRLIMLHSGEKIKKPLFSGQKYSAVLENRLVKGIMDLADLYGEFRLTDETQEALNDWHMADGPPTPTHSKMKSYNARRTVHLEKLCLASAASRGKAMVIELQDFERALGWLLEAEERMPDVFRAMASQHGGDVLRELYRFVRQKYFEADSKSVSQEVVIGYLADRVPQHEIRTVLETAIMGKLLIKQAAGDEILYMPGLPNGAWGKL